MSRSFAAETRSDEWELVPTNHLSLLRPPHFLLLLLSFLLQAAQF
jgi:hypothetical protein